MTVNNLTKSVTYCECVLGGQVIDNPGAIMQALVNDFNSDSTSPVTASLTSAGVTVTSKTPGTFLTISSSDNGAGLGGLGGIGFLGIPIVPTPNTASLTIVGSIGPNVCSGCSSTFTMNINGFSKSVTYCECVLGGQLIDSPGAIMQALVNAFNSDSTSPVTASLTSAGLTLTSKTAGTVLTVTSSDDGAGLGGLGGIGFLGVPIVPALDTAALSVVGSVGPNVCSGCSGTFSVNVNGFTKSVTYCECVLGGQIIDNPRAIEQALVNAFNSDSASPVTASLGSAGLELTANTLGTVLTVTSSDNAAGLGGLGGISFLGINGSLPGGSGPVPGFINPKYIIVGVSYAPPGQNSSVNHTNSTLMGNTTDIQHSFKNNVTVSVSVKNHDAIKAWKIGEFGGAVTGTSSTSYTQGSTDGHTVTINKTTTQSNATPGPANSFVGLDHDFDLVWLWLNPVIPLTIDQTNPNTITWNGLGFDPTDQPDLEVVPVPVGMLNGDIPISPDLAPRLARSWASGQAFPPGLGPGLTGPGPGTDFDTIVKADPFGECTPTPANCPTSVDPVRYTLTDSQNIFYLQAPVGGQPVPQTFGLNYTNTSTQSHGDSTELAQGFSLQEQFKGGIFGIGLEVTLNQSDTITKGTSTKTDLTTTTTNNITASITGPTCTVPTGQNFCEPEYDGDSEFLVYMDNKYGTFMFFPTKDPRFRLSAAPASQGVPVGGTVTYTVSSQALDGFTGDVSLSINGLPQGQGITASFNPTIIAGGNGSSTLTVTTSPSTPAATSNLTITGTSGTVVEHVPVVLQVQDFTIQVTPGSQTVTAGGNTAYQVIITPVDGMDLSTLALSVDGLPAGATGSFSPPTANGSGGLGSTLTITTTTSVVGGNYPLTVKGTVGSLTHNAVPVNLTVIAPDFTITADPGSQTVIPGGTTTYTVSTSALDGFNGSVALSLVGLPSGATATFNPTSINGSGNSTLTVTTSTSTPAGTSTLQITGASGSLSHTTAVNLVVNATPDFTISVQPQSAGINQGGTASYTVTTTAVNGFSGNVSLTVSGLPVGATATFSPNPIAGAGSSTLTVQTTSGTPVGNSTLTITGISGSLSHSAIATLTVNAAPDFTFSITPPQPINPGQCASFTLSIAARNGFNGTVSFSVTGVPAGATASFNPQTITGSGSVVLTICTSSSTPVGSYTITITATSGSLTHSQTFTLTVNAAPDFTISATPGSQTITAGLNASYTVSTTAANSFNGSIALSLTGLPSGATANFSPTAISGAGSATLTVTTTTATPAGSYPLTITGTSGSLTHNTTATLVVSAPPASSTPNISSLSVNHGPCGAVITISGTNFGSTPGTVTFNGTVAKPTWGASSISVPVPDGATSGNVVVTAGGQASNGVPFTVQEDAVHIFGVNCATCGSQLTQFTIQNAPLYNYVIQSGDVLSFYQSQAAAGGGMTLCFLNGDGSCDDDGSAVDQDGQRINSDSFHGVSHYRKVNLTPAAGLTLGQIIFDSSRNTPPGRWDVYFADVVIVSADGTVRPIFINGSTPSLYRYSTMGVTQQGSAIEPAHTW